jgi:transglutaminase/protease-like cytokinesis protein 3
MKKAFSLLAAAIVIASAAAVLLSDDSSADEFTQSYENQLDTEGQVFYTAYTETTTTATTSDGFSSSTGGIYTYTVSVDVSSFSLSISSTSSLSDLESEALLDDAKQAWMVLKLTDPYAWITWSYDDPDAAVLSVTLSSGSIVVTIAVSSTYYEVFTTTYSSTLAAVTAVEEAVSSVYSGLNIDSESDVDKVKDINAYLCGSDYQYDSDSANPYRSSIYGAFIESAKYNGYYTLLCSGYTYAFQALCTAAGVDCIAVFGTAAQSSDSSLHAWNEVYIDGKVYAVDVTFNATGDDETAYLCSGQNTAVDGVTFAQSHQAFTNPSSATVTDTADGTINFCGMTLPTSYALSESGYDWPTEESLSDILIDIAPWIMTAIICLILVYVLLNIAKKGE